MFGAFMSVSDALAAAEIARDAGRLLLKIRANGGTTAELKASGDAESQRFIAAQLLQCFPDDAVFSEEAPDSVKRLGARRVLLIPSMGPGSSHGEMTGPFTSRWCRTANSWPGRWRFQLWDLRSRPAGNSLRCARLVWYRVSR
jgi:hypothetical protein